jgi:hypothetical protein
MRLYNGAPDSALQAVWDSRDKARAELSKAAKELVEGKAWCTYFPVEQMYACAMWVKIPKGHALDRRFIELTPDFHPSVESACAAAIEKIREFKKL